MKDYKYFLEVIDKDIHSIFEYQKEYICCKEGCSYCCEKGSFPVTQLEFKYAISAFEKLPIETQTEIINNIKNTNQDELYTCPFLINNKCSIYSHRPIICRTFGVLMNNDKGNPTFPFCASIGLNFSQIYDKEKNTFSVELFQKNKLKVAPKIFKLRTTEIMNVPLAKELNLDFGNIDKMINFLNKKYNSK